MSSPTLLLHVFLIISVTALDLNGPWRVCSSEGKCYKGNVPGDVFTDLYKAGAIPHPLYGNNSDELGWVSREKWSYSRSFALSKEQRQEKSTLIFGGLDTVAKVFLNGKHLLDSDNQFRRHVVEVSSLLQENNNLEVRFDSPVLYVQHKNDKYKQKNGHALPPVCPPPTYHGECHPNFIRKAQYSFSWDWGPAIPTVGIWKPVRLLLAHRPVPIQVSWTTERENKVWSVQGSLEYRNLPGEVNCSVEVEGLGGITVAVEGKGTKLLRQHQFTLVIPENKVELWWPATEGLPKLYNLAVDCGDAGQLKEEIGFRTVELIQDLVDETAPQKGRNFYFKVNDRPLFLKGSNWIPATMFPGEDIEKRVDFLLDSAVEANMNVLRVWGGGVYESEYFYGLANRKGLLLWQDMMFACALYPTDKRFLATVAEEIEEQVFRLRKHPSILVFAGNNENEVAIRTHWWEVSDYSEDQQIEDYVALYADTVAPIIRYLDPSRPFLLSSPSNGQETELEGGVARNPGDARYGDIHFYNEGIDLWQDFNYLTPRCASEYGVQSIPFRNTMIRWIDENNWKYLSPVMINRQHHPGGVATNPWMIFHHFPVFTGCNFNRIHKCEKLNTPEYMDRFAYYSQAHQALAYKVQTEHYRRFRGRLTKDGLGNTMCALYWQLNDVWAAPTWSSVDFELTWKMAHYEAKRFFAPLIVVAYSTKWDTVAVSVVNDGKKVEQDAQVILIQFGWASEFEPALKETKTIAVPTTGSIDVMFESQFTGDYDSQYVIAVELTDRNGDPLAPTTVLLPTKLYETDLYLMGNVSIEDFRQLDKLTYEITVVADDISPLTWLSLDPTANILFWFSDNGFTMIRPKKTVSLHLREPHVIGAEMISVCNLKNCGLNQ